MAVYKRHGVAALAARSHCPASALPGAPERIWWMVLREALTATTAATTAAAARAASADALLAEWGVEREIRSLREAGDPICAGWVRAFPALGRWCPSSAK